MQCHFEIRFLLFCILLRTRLFLALHGFTYYTDDSHVTVLFFFSLCMTFGFLSDKSKWKSANHLKLNSHWPLHPSKKEPRLLEPILCLFRLNVTRIMFVDHVFYVKYASITCTCTCVCIDNKLYNINSI